MKTFDEVLATDVRFVERALEVLGRCQFPDRECDASVVAGTGYCAQHITEMRRRAITRACRDEWEGL